MPGTDDRIRDALHATAREPALRGVHARVRAKRRRRQVIRRIETGALAAALIAAVAVVSVNVIDENGGGPREIAVQPTGRGPVVRVADRLTLRDFPHRAKSARVPLDEEGYVRGPLLVSDDDVITYVAYRRTTGRPEGWDLPSRIVRVRTDGTVVDEVRLEGEVVSLAEGEGARWVLTHDHVVEGPQDPEFRVKRIGPDGTVASNSVPPGERPVGEIVASGGGVWVPVRDGVLRFDVTTGAFAAKVPLTTVTDRRGMAVGAKAVTVTDGLGQVRLDPASTAPGAPIVSSSIAGVDELVDGASGGAVGFVLGRDTDGSRWTVAFEGDSVRLPLGLTPTSLTTAGSVTWIEGRVDGAYVLQLDADGNRVRVRRSVFVGRSRDVAVTFLSEDRLAMTSDGRLYLVRLSD